MTTILLVEDDPALRRALRTTLRSRDFEVLEVATGEERDRRRRRAAGPTS